MTQTSGRLMDEFAKLATDAAGVAQGMRREVETVVKSQFERLISDMDLVPREDFEAVKEMAAKARDENDTLRADLDALRVLIEELQTKKAPAARKAAPKTNARSNKLNNTF